MSELLVEKQNSTIILTLNREKVLNALNLNMVRIISKNILQWKNDDNVSGVLIRGLGDKSFCAGGDIVSVYHNRRDKNSTLFYDFFREEYLLNYEISQFGKPWISLLNGIAMGGGLGLSVHGSHRIVSEKTITAMPETAIGLFPDVGGGYFLSRMQGYLGTYLALTGITLDGENSLYAGIGTNILENSSVNDFVKEILDLGKYNKNDIDNLIVKYDNYKTINPSLKKDKLLINKNFNKENIQEIFKSLKIENSDWSKKQLSILNKKSPTSMAVATKQLILSKELDIKECLKMEFRICQAMMSKHDFYEGVRANLVDKDRNPNWKPKNISELDDIEVDSHFKNLKDKELFNL
tara:strand:+ start:452 stop:1504 length:1053 start_codon:yes stop_codon:yes gene_type:complete